AIRSSCLQLKGIYNNQINERGCNNVRIKDVKFQNAKAQLPNYSGGYAITSWLGGADNVVMEDLEFENIGQSDLGIFEGFNWSVNKTVSKRTGYSIVNCE